MPDVCGVMSGKRVVVTRSVEQAQAFGEKLAVHGAEPVLFPVIQFERLPTAELDAALVEIEQFNWLLFTSANAVDFFFLRVEELGRDLILPPVAVSGSATADKLAARGVEVTFVPETFVGESLVYGLGDLTGQRVLMPRARIGRPRIAELLAEQGAEVADIALYDTVTAEPTPDALANLRRGFDAIAFTSPSSVRNFLKLVADHGLTDAVDLAAVVTVTIGPITTSELAKSGVEADVEPAEYTIDGMVRALCDYFNQP